MSKEPTLLLDVSYLAYRAFYAGMGQLSFNHIKTGVVYGVLKEIMFLQDRFQTKKIGFCFDVGKPNRSYSCPTYKSNRKENKSDEELKMILEVKNQLKLMRKEYLPEVGFQNIFWQKGFEADDVIAKIVLDRPKRKFIIVSSDQDLYQLLGYNCSIWNPASKELRTEEWFREKYGCGPEAWVQVKAMAGCSSDNVPGITGVGEKTALKFIRGELSKGVAFDKIVLGAKIWKSNLDLIRIPFPGIQPFTFVKDSLSPEGWGKLTSRLGMQSLTASIPGSPRRSATKKNSFTRATLGVFK